MSDAKDGPSKPAGKKPPAFGSVPDRDEGLVTGLGVAQPFEVDQPDSGSDQPADERTEGKS